MSSFGTGSISGGLNFDISPFLKGISEAVSTASTFPAAISSMIDAPLAGVAQSVSSAIGGLGDIGKSLLPGVGVLEAVGVAAGAAVVGIGLVGAAFAGVGSAVEKAVSILADWTQTTAQAALNTALLADKAGVSAKAFSELEHVGRLVNVSSQDISQGFRQIQNKAEMAAEGNKVAQKAFRDLGISMREVRANMGDPEKLFDRVHEKMLVIPTSAERTRRAIELLGRSGDNLKPLLAMDGLTFNKAIESSQRLGVVQSETSATMAKEFNKAEVQFDQAWEGMKRKATEPIMKFFVDHWAEIMPVVQKVADAIGNGVATAVAWLNEEVKNGYPHA